MNECTIGFTKPEKEPSEEAGMSEEGLPSGIKEWSTKISEFSSMIPPPDNHTLQYPSYDRMPDLLVCF